MKVSDLFRKKSKYKLELEIEEKVRRQGNTGREDETKKVLTRLSKKLESKKSQFEFNFADEDLQQQEVMESLKLCEDTVNKHLKFEDSISHDVSDSLTKINEKLNVSTQEKILSTNNARKKKKKKSQKRQQTANSEAIDGQECIKKHVAPQSTVENASFSSSSFSVEANQSSNQDNIEGSQKKVEPRKEEDGFEDLDGNSTNIASRRKAHLMCKQKGNGKKKRLLKKVMKAKNCTTVKQQPFSKNGTVSTLTVSKPAFDSSNNSTGFKSWREQGLTDEEKRHRKFGTAVTNKKAIIKSRQRKFSEITAYHTIKKSRDISEVSDFSCANCHESKVEPLGNTFSFDFDMSE